MYLKFQTIFFRYFKHKFITSKFFEPFRRLKRRAIIKKKYQAVIDELSNYGIHVIPNYLSGDQCDAACKQLRDALKRRRDFIHQNDDDRLFGVEHCIDEASFLKNDRFLADISEYVNGEPSETFFVLGGLLEAGGQGSSGGGWHRDAYFTQVKGMIYLTDVTPENGAFEYVLGSHKLRSIIQQHRAKDTSILQTRFADNDADEFLKRNNYVAKKITGAKGTLVIFNSTGLHRGTPILDGFRLSLTAYIFPSRLKNQGIIDKFYPVLGHHKTP